MSTPAVSPAPETPDSHAAFPRLTGEQIELLLERGERRRTKAGDILFREGEDHSGLFRSGSVQRVASAVGEGAMAVRLVHEQPRRTYA